VKPIDPEMADPRSGRDQLLGRMRAAGREQDPVLARRRALGIFRENLRHLISEQELLTSFAEPAGLDYIELWRREVLPLRTFSDLLSVHLAHQWSPEEAAKDPRIHPGHQRVDYARRKVTEVSTELEYAIDQWPEIRKAGGIDPATALAWLQRLRPHLAPSLFLPPAEEVVSWQRQYSS
jgi:hypothetical protein